MREAAFRSLVVPAMALLCLSTAGMPVEAQSLTATPIGAIDAENAPLNCSAKTAPDQILAATFLQAWICRNSGVFWKFLQLPPPDPPPTWNQPFPPTNLNGYGCYCGSGSTGLDTAPVEGYDTCCRQHDIDWTAICQSTPDPEDPTLGCNCYLRIPAAIDCVNKKLTYPKPKDDAKPDPCADKCAAELNKQFDCYAKVYESTNKPPAIDRYRNQCAWEHDPNPAGRVIGNAGPRKPFNLVPSYCQKSPDPIPGSDFLKPDQKLDPGDNLHFTCTCTLVSPDCSEYVTACTGSAGACERVGGIPSPSCYDDEEEGSGGSCEPTVDLTAESCPYRSPRLAPCDSPPRPAFCDIRLRLGESCNPVTGGAGDGGTCGIYGEDIIACLPGPPGYRPPVIDVLSLSPATISAVKASADVCPR